MSHATTIARCRHVCRCGAVLICSDPDRCAIGPTPFVCHACELDAIDSYFNRLEQQPAHEQESTHERH